MRIAIFLHNEPTRSGAILSEIKYLHEIAKANPDHEYVIWTTNDSLKKKVLENWDDFWSWTTGVVNVWPSGMLVEEVQSVGAVLTSPLHSNLFGGLPNKNQMLSYLVISHLTNSGVKVYFRLNDSEMIVRDYKLTLLDRFARKTISKETKAEVLEIARGVVHGQVWDYNNVYWLANGSTEYCDWAAETLWDKATPFYRIVPKQVYQDRIIYASDDVFFQVGDKYKTIGCNYAPTMKYEPKFCYIGFFDTINTKRAKVWFDIFKKNEFEIPVKIFGHGTEILDRLEDKPNIEIVEGLMAGDSAEFYDFLNSHMAYIFIGKGGGPAKYVGKTVYDCYIASTPVVIYHAMDPEMKIFGKSEYYFKNEYQLKSIHNQLQDPKVRLAWVEDQRKLILKHLPPCSLKF